MKFGRKFFFNIENIFTRSTLKLDPLESPLWISAKFFIDRFQRFHRVKCCGKPTPHSNQSHYYECTNSKKIGQNLYDYICIIFDFTTEQLLGISSIKLDWGLKH